MKSSERGSEKGCWLPAVDEALSGMMSNFCPDCLEGWDHSIPINRLDMSWSLSLCPLYMTLNLGCPTSCLISHFVALRLTVSSSDWGDPLEIRLKKAALMDETSSHLQSFLAIPVSSLSRTPSTLLLTYNNCRQSIAADRRRQTDRTMKINTVHYLYCIRLELRLSPNCRGITSRRQRGQKRAEGLRCKSKNTCNTWGGKTTNNMNIWKCGGEQSPSSGSHFSRWRLHVLLTPVWVFFKHFGGGTMFDGGGVWQNIKKITHVKAVLPVAYPFYSRVISIDLIWCCTETNYKLPFFAMPHIQFLKHLTCIIFMLLFCIFNIHRQSNMMAKTL